jgi:hypothetical protein
LTGLYDSSFADVVEGAIYVTMPPGIPMPEFQKYFESLPWSGEDPLQDYQVY